MRTAPRPIPEITPEVEAKFWSKVDKRPDGIWAWKGTRLGKPGYARFLIGYVPFYANRLAWVLHQRKTKPDHQIPDGLFVCHRNDVTEELYDCNPENLWLGTHLQNMLDREAKGRGNYDGMIDLNEYIRKNPWCLKRGDDHHARRMPERVAKGERSGHAKLTWVQVHEIRALHATGEFTHKEIAARFGVTWFNIRAIVKWKSWRTESGNAFSKKALDSPLNPAPLVATSVTK